MRDSEFNHLASTYWHVLDKSITISGESGSFFAYYRATKLAEWLPELQNKSISIFDFGCGDGLMTNFVSSYFKNATLYGVDPAQKSIELAKKNFPHINFSTNSEEDCRLNFPTHSFDISFAAGSFHHIPFEKHAGYLQELARVTKHNGYIVIFELNPFNPITVLVFKRSPIDKNATLLKPPYLYSLLKNYGSPKLKFYGFFPHCLQKLRYFEKFMTKIPCGALYAVILKKITDYQ